MNINDEKFLDGILTLFELGPYGDSDIYYDDLVPIGHIFPGEWETDYSLLYIPEEYLLLGLCPLCLNYDDSNEEHHITYFPEKTILICKPCHIRIHNSHNYYLKLKPPEGDAYRFYKNKITRREKKILRFCNSPTNINAIKGTLSVSDEEIHKLMLKGHLIEVSKDMYKKNKVFSGT